MFFIGLCSRQAPRKAERNEKERAEGKYTDGGVSGRRRKAAVPASGDINLDSIPAFEWPPPPSFFTLLFFLVRSQALCAIERPHKA